MEKSQLDFNSSIHPMCLNTLLIPKWPKLAWVAVISEGSTKIDVFHGPMVEIVDEWIVEAVWAGDFESGDFDRTDLVFGTGVRLRKNKVYFVSSGTGADRIWHCCRRNNWFVSNSLPALLATADLTLRDDYGKGYTIDIESVERLGLKAYKRSLPTTTSDVHILYFDNLLFENGVLKAVDKPNDMPHFNNYDDYYKFLENTAQLLLSNLSAEKRQHTIHQLTTISSGYDSTAAAAVAKIAGCKQAVTIKNATSLWRGSDSGKDIAHDMGLSCRVYQSKPKKYRRETTLWAAAGLAGGMNLTIFDYPKPLCLLFTGCYGDAVWDRRFRDLTTPVGDRDALIGEFRLFEGLFHSIVPWWGICHAQEINALGAKEEMVPWTLHTEYDRPVARRLAEDAGALRKSFGQLKKDTSANVEFLWPFSKEDQASFRRYLKERDIFAPGPFWILLIRKLAHFEKLLHRNLLQRFGVKKRFRPWMKIAGAGLLFQWANHDLKKKYEAGLQESLPSSPVIID